MDRTLQSREYQEAVSSPAQDEEFVLSHADNVEAAGFVSHLKLPHYVDFQAELALLKRLRSEHLAASSALFTPQLSSSSLPSSSQPSSSSQPPSSQRQEPHHD